MSDQQSYVDAAQTAPKKEKRWVKPVLYVVGAAVIFSLGTTAAGGEPEERIVEVPVVEEVEVVKEVEVPGPERVVVPQACLNALNDAEAINDISADFAGKSARSMEIAAEAIMAAAAMDYATVEALIPEMDQITEDINLMAAQVGASTFPQNRDACRAEAGQ